MHWIYRIQIPIAILASSLNPTAKTSSSTFKMSVELKINFVSSTAYNSLPCIGEVAHAPQDHADDLNDLRLLLTKHSVPSSVSIRLIHKHFDTKDGEVMAFKEVPVPSIGTVYSMGPLHPAQESSQLFPVHYYVDEIGSFQGYEYTTAQVPDLSQYTAFLAEFSRTVVERGLHRTFGLKLNSEMDMTGWVEFEFRDKRSTIIIPDGKPIPDGIDYDFELNVVTEWSAKGLNDSEIPVLQRVCVICSRTCIRHSRENKLPKDSEVYLGGQKIEWGSPVYTIVNAVIEVW